MQIAINFTPQNAELMIAALRKLPHETVDVLLQDVWQQFQAEIKRLQAETRPVEVIEQ